MIKIDGLEIINKQQRNVLHISNVLVALGTTLNLLGLVGTQDATHRIVIIVYTLVIASLASVQYLRKKPNLRVLIGSRLLAAQILICTKMILFALYNEPNAALMITTNVVVLGILLLLALLAYLHYFTYLLSFLTIIAYAFCAYLLNNDEVWRNLPVYILLFSAGAFLSSMLAKGVNTVLLENEKYRLNTKEMLSALGMTEAEFSTYTDFSKENKRGNKAVIDIFHTIGDGPREMLKKNVSYLMEQDKIVYDKIGELIPEFTPSEVEIAKLIVEGKRIVEMIPILMKKKSNITCQRVNMRVKLKLNAKDNLRDAILKRVAVENTVV